MRNLIVLSTLLIISQATDIQKFYGNWVQVAFYPSSAYIPVCVHYSFLPSTENLQCTYADRSNVTALEISRMNQAGVVLDNGVIPVVVVNSPSEVMRALNTSCECSDKDSNINGCAAVLRLVNDNFFIMYTPLSMESQHSEIETNSAFLYAKKVVPSVELYNVMMSIEDLKSRRGAMMCGTENYTKDLINENEINVDFI